MSQSSNKINTSSTLENLDYSKFKFKEIDINDIEKNEREYHSTFKHIWLQIKKTKPHYLE